MSENVSKFWQDAYDGAKEESSGGVIGKGLVRTAYVVYAEGFTGDDQEKCIFAPGPGKDGRKKALKSAQDFAESNGMSRKDARWHLVTTIYADETVRANGNDVTWQGDRLEKVPLWTLNSDTPSAAKEVMAALEEHGVRPGKPFYARFGWTNDPYKVHTGVMDGEDQEGNPKYKQICVVQEVFKSKEDAAAAVGSNGNGDSGSDRTWAEGWSDEDLTAMVNTFTTEKGEYDDFAELVDNEAGEDVTWGINLLSEVGEMDVDDIANFTGLKKGKIRKALK